MSGDSMAMSGTAVVLAARLAEAEEIRGRLAMARAARRAYQDPAARRLAYQTAVQTLGIARPQDAEGAP